MLHHASRQLAFRFDRQDEHSHVELNVSRVLNVLLLLAVAGGLLEGADDEGRGGGDDGADGLTVLDRELDGDTESLPVAGGLGDVLSDLLGRLCERTNAPSAPGFKDALLTLWVSIRAQPSPA